MGDERAGTILGGAMGEPESGHARQVKHLVPRWQKGQSGNPSGRPKCGRLPSTALAQLNDTTGDDPCEMIQNFRAARGKQFCAADAKAIAAFRRDLLEDEGFGVASFANTTERIEGKVEQNMNLKSEASLTIRIIDRDVQLSLLRAAEQQAKQHVLTAEVIEEGGE